MRYLRMALDEVQQARVPNQLLSRDDQVDDEQDLDELNVVSAGGMMGYAGTQHEKEVD